MELVLNRYVTSVVIIITVPATLFLSCLLLLAPLTASTIISLTVFIPLFRFCKIIIVMFYLCVGGKTFIYYPFRRPSVTLTSPWHDVFGKIKEWRFPILVKQMTSSPALSTSRNTFRVQCPFFSSFSHNPDFVLFWASKVPNQCVSSSAHVSIRQHTAAYGNIHRTCLGKWSLTKYIVARCVW